jgi:hypothetical protein
LGGEIPWEIISIIIITILIINIIINKLAELGTSKSQARRARLSAMPNPPGDQIYKPLSANVLFIKFWKIMFR